VSLYSNLQGSLMTRTKYAVHTARFYIVFLGLKSAVLLFLSLKLEGYKFKNVNMGTAGCQDVIYGLKPFSH